MSVKYGGQHVKGSPFTVRVSGAPDPDKVKVYGPGVEHGVLAMYQVKIGKQFISKKFVEICNSVINVNLVYSNTVPLHMRHAWCGRRPTHCENSGTQR